MDCFKEASLSAMATASAFTVAVGAYLNAKLSISTDLSNLANDRAFGKRLGERIAQLGESTTIYKMLERVVDVDGQGAADALWFEQKTWSYTRLKDCQCFFNATPENHRLIMLTVVVDRFAALLHARGVKEGDFVGVFTTNSPEMVVTLYALAKLGAIAAMINTYLRGQQFRSMDAKGFQ